MVEFEDGKTLVIGSNLTCHLWCLVVVVVVWDLAMFPRLALDFCTLGPGPQGVGRQVHI